ncbi:MAG: choice-of-anchor M domain-containing protein [Schaalia hyovaginalis]|uniref:choice-of-anchor M domain-containing protein n=1 Tax=Schaalia hyovaginalis TaxID=29316 RepID=UPI0023FA20DC|nr:choice-of-anchor M domain-containing protein [Schaalia hyovaginalis]MCI7671956.1 choice-of-anchor M domain-containing protein [Schaalia hyovaginalis]MDY5506775.1 choice-of-anchor M domain-containing protein [Schaalia hyovaginalis]
MRIHSPAALLVGAALLLAPLASAPAARAESPESDAPALAAEHKPGQAGVGDLLPADLTVPAGSSAADPTATPGADGRVAHACAGRKILHHSHVDAAYATRIKGELAMTVIDGQQVLDDPASVCIRLAPDARSSDGREVSRMVIPSQPKGLFDFLGKPGDIVWNAPQELVDNWRPVWAGIGAFDVHHENSLPEGVLLDEISIQITGVSGPGRVEVWRTVGSDSLSRGLSSDPSLAPLKLRIGSHGHWNWSFTQAGVYRLTMVASYLPKDGGERVVSRPTTVTWLVGSDAEVGLPEGTTTSLTPVSVSAEQVRDQPSGSGAPSAGGTTGGSDPAPAAPAADTTSVDEARAQINTLFRRPQYIPAPPSAPQNYVYAASMTDAQRNGKTIKAVELTVTRDGAPTSDAPILEVPDSLRQKTEIGEAWVLPASGPNGSLGYDFTKMPAELRSQPIVFDVAVFSGPKEGRYIAGTIADGKMTTLHDTVTRAARKNHTNDPKALPLAHVFTKPGVYKVEYSISADDVAKNHSYASRVAYFVVGDAAIRALKEIDAEKKQPTPAPDAPSQSGGTSGSKDPVSPSAPAEGETSGGAAASPLHLITEGHMDQALALKDGKAQVFVLDTVDPRKPVTRESGTFAYAVPDRTHAMIPGTAKGYEELRAAAPKGVWSLPETQIEGIPWVGFSTERVDYSALGPAGVTVRLANFTGPGRLITGNTSLFDGFVTRLDSLKPDTAISYRFGSHDHQAFYFTAPGRYATDFVYTAHLKDGTSVDKTLRAVFLVGDAAIAKNVAGGAAPAPGSASGSASSGRGRLLPIDELVASLNAAARAESSGGASTPAAPAASTGAQAASSPIPLPTSAHPILGAPSPQGGTVTQAAGGASPAPVSSGATASSSASAPSGASGSSAVSGTLVSASGSGEDGAAEGLSFEEGTGEGSIRALSKADSPVSALLNPERGSAASPSSAWWSWILVGIGISAFIGVGGWAFFVRRRA